MNEVRITVPEGMEIDRENSTFECIKFKPKAETYEDVAKKLFFDKDITFIDTRGEVKTDNVDNSCFPDANNCTTTKQAAKLLAINKLMNVAKYLNDGWQPDWENAQQIKCFFAIQEGLVYTSTTSRFQSGEIYFKSEELAERALAILGEETIRLALCTDW